LANPARGEFWLIDFSPTKGRGQAGTRPSLIISDDRFNLDPAGLVVVLPRRAWMKWKRLCASSWLS